MNEKHEEEIDITICRKPYSYKCTWCIAVGVTGDSEEERIGKVREWAKKRMVEEIEGKKPSIMVIEPVVIEKF